MRRPTVRWPTSSPLGLIVSLQLALFAPGCADGGEEESAPSQGGQPAVVEAAGATGGAGAPGGGGGAAGTGGTGMGGALVGPVGTAGGGASAPTMPGAAGAGGAGAGVGGGMSSAGTGGTGGTGGGATTGGAGATTGGGAQGPATPAGPDDGDPGQPVVAIPNVKCGPNPSLFGLTTTNVTIGGRKVHVSYPCNKRKGAPVTFILNLHGTMPAEELKLYQVAYFAATNYVTSHNLITVAPISAGSQWGNDDGGKDLPHLKEVIAWTYSTFKDFDIRSMWIGGHSWGAMFTTKYACDAELQSKVRGVILMSTSPMMPACANRISVINTNAENDIAGPLPQGNVPMQHGCAASMTTKLGNNDYTLWPNCTNGFVHANYLMYGKAHADYMDDVVVKSIVDLIKSARP